jgi:hypothetical protein
MEECKRSLQTHGMYDFSNQISLVKRIGYYEARMLLSKLGLSSIVKIVKKIKSSEQS